MCDVPELTVHRPGMEDRFINFPSYKGRTWDNVFKALDEEREAKHPVYCIRSIKL